MENKKIYSTSYRQYRDFCIPRQGEHSFQLLLAESDIKVIVASGEQEGLSLQDSQNLACEMLKTLEVLRADIASWARVYPEFRHSLSPLKIPKNAPKIVRRMYEGASKAGVGPFAAVAGSIAQILAETYSNLYPDLIIENGGDIYMFSSKERVVALLSEPEKLPQTTSNINQKTGSQQSTLGLRFGVDDFPLALCASSATIGHSLSLGNGELAVVRAKSASLADAVATALGNRLRSADTVQDAINFAQNIVGVEGVFVQCDDAMGVWGAMELVAL